MSAIVSWTIALGLLWFQISVGPSGWFGLDWSLCGLLVLCVRTRSPVYSMGAMGLGLLRDTFSVVPLGAQALGMGITAGMVHFLRGLIFLENFWIQGLLFFCGYLLYQVVFFCLGMVFGYLDGGFWQVFPATIPKAIFAAIFCWLLLAALIRWVPQRPDL